MKQILLLLITILLLTKTLSKSLYSTKYKVSCKGFELKWFMKCFFIVSAKKTNFDVKFYLASNDTIEPLSIDSNHVDNESWKSLDTSKKTYIIVHGYMSSGNKNWVKNLKNAILKTNEFNVIIVDWSDGCNTYNYVSAAKNTIHASYKIHMFLYQLKEHVEKSYKLPSDGARWNNLYVIGHSLGAHVAGQLSAWLKQSIEHFFKIEKITGLDPAGPCFSNTSKEAQLDKYDADFVEVIHTQHSDYFSLGSSRPSGTVDFYVNGGADQPECKKQKWSVKDWNGRICSHKIAYKYFLESFHHYHTKECRFEGYPWDGSYNQAKIIFDAVVKGKKCIECPEMGYGSSKGSGFGKFLVITSSEEPYCHLKKKDSDYDTVKSVIEELKIPVVLEYD